MSEQTPAPSCLNPRKAYTRPVLARGPVLSAVTASISASRQELESDRRLKRDIHPLQRLDNGLALYRFRYLWSEVELVGVIAQEVLEFDPEAVVVSADGFYRVDYGRLGLRCMTYVQWLAGEDVQAAA